MDCQRLNSLLLVIVSPNDPPHPGAWPLSQLSRPYQLHLSISRLPSLTLIGFGFIMQRVGVMQLLQQQ